VFDAFSDFLSVNGNVFGRVNANANLHTLNSEHGHGSVLPDPDGLTDPTREDKHSRLPFQQKQRRILSGGTNLTINDAF
jgi:hypothetical protein